ncbi:T9SS type B sorting domain-containing protein [Luteirhabdus pelagi]|uniref:T9SS type B sorting domain-containing protein n=1 Tax=Luteirhabdus pelagi TaxID=2792783 RepID=UPI00293D2744|nr:T9SS type B sorting domain-containing protein [Luteirhabdus pelagi]
MSTFDLTSRNGLVTGGDLSLSVEWFATPADEAADAPVADATAWQNLDPVTGAAETPQTVVGRVENAFGCRSLVTLTLVVLDNPTPVDPEPLAVCDDNNDGFAEFDLTEKDAEITGPETGLVVTYHGTEANAVAGLGALAVPYENDTPFSDTVWARVEDGATGCYTVVALGLVVDQLPLSPGPGFGDLFSCDGDGGGSAVFDLTVNTVPALNGQGPAGYTVTYHTSALDAGSGTGAIGTPANASFASTGQTVWVRVEDDATGCARVTPFELVVGALPSATAPADLELCDDEVGGSTDTDGISTFDLSSTEFGITSGDTSLSVEWYATPADQASGAQIADPSSWQNYDPADGVTPESPQTVYFDVVGQGGCRAQGTLTLVVLPVPSPAEPSPLEACDADGDGFAGFVLTDRDAEILDGQAGTVVTYHETLADAGAGVMALSSPYQNLFAGGMTVWARVEFAIPPDDSGCHTVVPLELVVVASPVAPVALDDLEACDTDGDGQEAFDLTVQDAAVYGSQDPSGLVLTYHETAAAADAGTPSIAAPSSYVSGGGTVWARLAGASGCYDTVPFGLVVSQGPTVVDPAPYDECDDLGEPYDGVTVFDLTSRAGEITGAAEGVEVRFYETLADAQADEDRIEDEVSYQNVVPFEQVVYVRVVDGDVELCPGFTELRLRVLPNPVLMDPPPLETCDATDPGDGIEEFDLTAAVGTITVDPDLVASFYETEAEAVAGTGAIADPAAYENQEPFSDVVYVRVERPGGNGCFGVVALELLVYGLPDPATELDDLVACDAAPFDGVALFDLTVQEPFILAGLDAGAGTYAVTYYRTEADAVAGQNPIVNETTHANGANPDQVWVGVEVQAGSDGSCYLGGVLSFALVVQDGAEAFDPLPYVLCDNVGPSDGVAEFDLTLLDAEALGGQDPAVYSVTYHETQEGAESGTGAIASPGSYQNVVNPQVVYVRVENSSNAEPRCYGVSQVLLQVDQLPALALEESYRLCVDAQGNPIPEDFGGASPPVLDTGLDPSLYSFEWSLDGQALPDSGPSLVAVAAGTYSVTVTELEGGCQYTAEAQVVASSPPQEYSATDTAGAFAGEHVVEVTATGLGDYEYSLDGGPFQGSNVFAGVSPGEHLVVIRDRNGCGEVELPVGVIDYPRYFTPNQDGYHDTWNIIGIAAGDPTAKIFIFDRFGKLLKQVSPTGAGWDGTYNGAPLPSSDYWFRVEYTEDGDAREFRGHFTLKR